MCALRRVEGDRAGPAALGILVPPAHRTFLILRPRSLSWDLLLLRAPEGSTFRDLGRDEADAIARRLPAALEAWSAGGPGWVELAPTPDGKGYWLRAWVGEYAFLACPRRPGQPYQPQVFARRGEADEVAQSLRAVLCPPAGVEQEFYFNTRHFGR